MPFTFQVSPIALGCHYALLLTVSTDGDGPFLAGAAITARFSDFEGAAPIGMLSTASGSLYRVDTFSFRA